MTRTANERQREVRAQRKEQGWRPFEIWLSPNDQDRVDKLRHFSESMSEFLSRAIQSLEQGASPNPSPLPSTETSNAARGGPSVPRTRVDQARKAELAERTKALYAQGLSLGGIARLFNTEGIPTLSGSGKWRHKSIRGLLEV